MLNVRLPRMDAQVKNTLDRADIARARAQMALSLDLTRARYELEQRKKARTKSLDKHSKLLADRELMEIKAPADGVVYYGQCVNGRWPDANSLKSKYQPHNNVSGGSILMTIVDERPLSIVASLDEANRPEVSADQKARVALPAEAADRLNGKVQSISSIPVSTGKFEIMFDVEESELPSWIVAGLGCKVNVTTYDKAEAVVVPKKAVHDDEVDPEKHYVWLLDPNDEKAKPQRRDVTLGKAKGDELEIRKGLEKGNVISLDDEKEKDQTTWGLDQAALPFGAGQGEPASDWLSLEFPIRDAITRLNLPPARGTIRTTAYVYDFGLRHYRRHGKSNRYPAYVVAVDAAAISVAEILDRC